MKRTLLPLLAAAGLAARCNRPKVSRTHRAGPGNPAKVDSDRRQSTVQSGSRTIQMGQRDSG